MSRHRVLAIIALGLMLLASQVLGQQAVRRVGVLASTEIPELTQVFLEGLREEHGYIRTNRAPICRLNIATSEAAMSRCLGC